MNPAISKNSVAASLKAYVILFFVTLMVALPGLSNLPVIDRDEARYTQASVQMAESGDYVNIRFQDRARNKKPAGVYWMQAAMIKTFSETGERRLWAQRLPSVLGALIAVWATYWGGLAFLNRRDALFSALLLCVSFGLVFEAHIAKTDALLCGVSALTLASLLHMRKNPSRKYGILFWGAMGVGLMIKGPVILAIAVLCILSLIVWERQVAWIKPLLYWAGPVLLLVLVLPWVIMIWKATDGAFFNEAIGGDLGSKLGGEQEKHGGPIGYYAATLWVFFWPAGLFLPAALVSIFQTLRKSKPQDLDEIINDVSIDRATIETGMIRLLICWAVPFFLLLEFIPTKLPHYPLPLYPALALLCGAAFQALGVSEHFKKSRRVGVVLYALFWGIITLALLGAHFTYGPKSYWILALYFASSLAVVYACRALWKAHISRAVISACISAILLMVPSYAILLPSLTPLRIADQLVSKFQDLDITLPRRGGPNVLSPHFTEPSLIYHFGKQVRLGDQVDFDNPEQLSDGTVVLIDMTRENSSHIKDTASQAAVGQNLCLKSLGKVEGLNYSKGDLVELAILQVGNCAK